MNDFRPQFIMWEELAWRADRVVSRMTPHQRAMYRNLLMECYVGNERPYLTTDDGQLWQIAEADSLENWLVNKPRVIVKFIEMVRKDDGKVLFSNNKVIEVWNNLEDKLDQKRNAGRASAKARRLAAEEKKETIQQQQQYNRALSSVEHPLSSVEHTSTDVERPLKSIDVAETPLSKQLIGNERENGGPHNFHPPSKDGGSHNDFQQPIKKEESNGSARAKSNVEVMGGFREIYIRYNRYPQIGFSPTKPHQKAAIDFYERYGQAVALAAWACFLVRDDPEVVSNGKKQPRAHRLNDFCAAGGCETCAKRIKDLTPDELEFVAQHADKCADNLRYTSYLKQDENGDLHGFIRYLMQVSVDQENIDCESPTT